MHSAEYWIRILGLQNHPEGGYFKETYKSNELIKRELLPERYSGDRFYSSSIFFLITSDNFSAFHRIKSDETWHFYCGSSLTLHILDMDGKYSAVKLGNNPENDEVFQYTIKRDNWFAAEVNEKNTYSLLGCTVSPGFNYDDFELGKREELVKKYNTHVKIVNRLTKA